MSKVMLRTVIVAAAAALAGALAFAAPASADAPKFHRATSDVANSGALVVAFDERGLGNGNIDYTLTADATAVFACINGGNNHPQAANKETVNAEVVGGRVVRGQERPGRGQPVGRTTIRRRLQLSARAAPGIRERVIHQRRSHRYDQRRDGDGRRRVAHVLRRLVRVRVASTERHEVEPSERVADRRTGSG